VRCVHINRVGDQCRDQALEGRQLCAFHARILEDIDPEERMDAASGRSESRSRFPMIYRLAALILLLLMLLDTFGSIRTWMGW
jgi:hypothetical protein